MQAYLWNEVLSRHLGGAILLNAENATANCGATPVFADMTPTPTGTPPGYWRPWRSMTWTWWSERALGARYILGGDVVVVTWWPNACDLNGYDKDKGGQFSIIKYHENRGGSVELVGQGRIPGRIVASIR